MNGKAIIQGFWVGNELSVMEQLSIASFLKHGHEYHLYLYEEVAHVPNGAIVKNAEEIIPYAKLFSDRELSASYANFSDIFRYKLLLDKGGFWVDLDTICLRPFQFQNDYVFASEKTQEDSEGRRRFGFAHACGGIMKVPKCSPMMQFCYERSLQAASGEYSWWDLGPPLVAEAVEKFDLREFVQPPHTFLPVDWWDWEHLLSEQWKVRLQLQLKLLWKRPVYSVHLWNSMWKRTAMDKNQRYPHRCFYEQLKRTYLE